VIVRHLACRWSPERVAPAPSLCGLGEGSVNEERKSLFDLSDIRLRGRLVLPVFSRRRIG
jgi:hypothetical protein